MMPAATAPAQPQPVLVDFGCIRVTGALADDATLALTLGSTPVMLLTLHLQPVMGLPYLAQVDLGPDVADHMGAEALMPKMRRGAAVSVSGSGLRLRTEGGTNRLVLLHARDVLVLSDPLTLPTEG